MAYILASDGRDFDYAGDCYRAYSRYLDAAKDAFPQSAYRLATSDWYFNFQDHRCPHDSWLETANLIEVSSGERHEIRYLSLTLRLLGAYHDGFIELHYPRVFSYAMNCAEGDARHRDWRYDELRLSERGNLIHEIEWCGYSDTGHWIIEASDIEYRWLPGADINR